MMHLFRGAAAVGARGAGGSLLLRGVAAQQQFRGYHYAPRDDVQSPYTTWHGTTILCVRKNNKEVVIGDGQVSQGSVVVKPNATKVRRLKDGIIAGYAGATADAFTLMERLEQRLEEHPGQLMRACVELAKAWRTDKYLRRLEATMIVSSKEHSFEITGGGDVLETSDGIIGIGSGGQFAIAAARALIDREDTDAEEIARKALQIAGDMCIYTNHNVTVEVIDSNETETAQK